MEKVVYILGAGFSAPLGVPVMGNFLSKSKDLYFQDEVRYQHFSSVFKAIQSLSVTKNYYQSDLFNIEEILSILEMQEFLKDSKLTEQFARYICDVVNYFTPRITPIENRAIANWYDFALGNDVAWKPYAYWVASMMRLKFVLHDEKASISNPQGVREVRVEVDDEANSRYAVLSLNYDLVLECVSSEIKKCYGSNITDFDKGNDKSEDWARCALAKLHGCAELGEIVPPTWAKGTHKSIIPTWGKACSILTQANHIRFIGYSLPLSDSYIKYLLKAAVLESQHLKSIDVICLDPDGSAKKRYDNFFEFNNYRFRDASISDYLAKVVELSKSSKTPSMKDLNMNKLEPAHDDFMGSAS